MVRNTILGGEGRIALAAAAALLSLGAVASCGQIESEFRHDAGLTGGRMSLKVEAAYPQTSSEAASATKTVYDAASHRALWSKDDCIAVAASTEYGLSYTDVYMMPFTSDLTDDSPTATFSGSLVNGGEGEEYTLFAIFPYTENQRPESPSLTLPVVQHPSADSWDPQTDFMAGVSEPVEGDDVTCATEPIVFTHLLGWLRLSFSNVTAYGDEKVYYVRVSVGRNGKSLAGTFSIDLPNQTIDDSDALDKFVMADYSGEDIALKDLTAYLTLLPGTYSNVSIAVKTEDHYLEFARTSLTITAGEVNKASVTFGGVSTDSAATSQASLVGDIPVMDDATGGELHFLQIGHSFGVDATEYLPNLAAAAGITNMDLHRTYAPDCSLQTYWDFVCTGGMPQQYSRITFGRWDSPVTYPMSEIIQSNAWDIILFQQSTAGSGTTGVFTGSGDYSTYQPWLSLLMEYTSMTMQTRYGKKPLIGWDMIHSYNTNRSVSGDIDASAMHAAIVGATQQMMAESGISFVVGAGTALQEARAVYSDPQYNFLCADSWHASQGIGRYVMSCTMFQQLVVPVYGTETLAGGGGETGAGEGEDAGDISMDDEPTAAVPGITVLGNTFRPTNKSNNYDQVTDAVAATLQAIAVNVAANPLGL